MARKTESEHERSARVELKERHAAEARACSAFFDVADRRVALEAEMAQLERDEAAAVASMAAVADAATVAELIGWSANRVRSAAKLANDKSTTSPGGEAIHTAADVAS